MNEQELREVLIDALTQVAPEVDPAYGKLATLDDAVAYLAAAQ